MQDTSYPWKNRARGSEKILKMRRKSGRYFCRQKSGNPESAVFWRMRLDI